MTQHTHNPKAASFIAANRRHGQRGVLLVVTLIMLLIISGIAAVSIKGAGSTEIVANNARTQAMAMQVAEAALRYCEMGAINEHRLTVTETFAVTSSTHTFAIRPAPVNAASRWWRNLSSWQGASPVATAISLSSLDTLGASSSSSGSSTFALVFKRDPDCIAQYAEASNKVLWITARGFGPDVAQGSVGSIPFGSEVFLQSTLRLP